MARPLAADNLWTNASGNSTWDTTTANWTDPLVWSNAALDAAVFGPTGAGSVTLSEPITVSGIRFEAAGYAINPGGAIQLAGGIAIVQTDADATIAAPLIGASRLIKTGDATLTLSGVNNYTGGTLVSEGTLRIGDGGTTGSVIAPITNNAELVFDRSNSLSGVGVLGSGHVTKRGSGALGGTFLHTGGTTVEEGTLNISLGTGYSQFAGDVMAMSDAAVVFVPLVPFATYSGNMSGAGLLSKHNSGILVVTGANTHTGGTRVFSGTLQLGDGGTTGSVAGDVIVNSDTALAFNRSDDTVFAGAISGAGRMTKLSANTLALTGANTYTGGTTISAGTLSIGNGGATGSIMGNITNNATLAFNRSDDGTYDGIISGSGNVVKSGAGAVALTGNNTYTGGTTIAGGTLSIGNGGSTGSITGYVANNGVLAFNRSSDITFSGTVAGSGSVVKLGTGRTTLTGAFTHTGGTTVSAGILQVGNNFSGGHLAGNVLNNASVIFVADSGQLATYAGNMSGAGSLLKTGTGGNNKLTLTGTNTYSGGTTISDGTLQVGDGGTSGSIAGNVLVNFGDVLAFHRSDAITFAGGISGDGSLHKLGAGTLTLTGGKTGGGTTTIFDGTLAIGDGVSSGNIAGTIVNNSKLSFNPAGNAVHSGVIAGPGSMTKLGSGTLSLSGNNTYIGGTTVSAGALSIGNGGSTGSITGDIVNNAAVVFNRSDSAGVYNGTMTGPGAVTKLGAGTYTITGSLRHTGGTTVSAGTLQIGGGSSPGGSVNGPITNNGFVRFAHTEDVTHSHVISGTGGLNKSGSGRLVLTGENTYAGTTAISAGALQIGGGGTTGSIAGPISVQDFSDVLAFHRSDDLVVPNAISGGGAIENLGTNRLTLTGDSSFEGLLFLNQGTLSIGAGGTSGSIAASIFNDTEVEFNRSDNSTFTGSIGGDGAVVKRGAGALSLAGPFGEAGGLFGHTGGTTVEAGTLRLGTGSSLRGNVLNNAAIEYYGAATQQPLVLAANISGTGTFAKTTFTSQLAITGANTYTGGTRAYGGILQIGDGGTVGSVVGDVDTGAVGLGIGTIAFNRSDDIVFPGTVSGAGHLRKSGDNTLHLTAAHTYTGSTEIVEGTLVLDGSASISASSNVETSTGATLDVSQLTGGLNYEGGRFALAAGQSLSGRGTVVGEVTARAGASVAPGPTSGFLPSPATLTIAGSVEFQPGSSLDILLGLPFSSDRLAASGAITFSGAADNPFTIDVANRNTFVGEPRAFVIATGSSIDSSGLDTPLSVVIGPDGTAQATNEDHIRLNVSGFAEHSAFTLLRAGNELRLQYVSPVSADFDDSGVVDAGDLARWTANAGVAAGLTNEAGDADADGDVDGADFLSWQQQLGSDAASPVASVPEPVSAVMGLVAMLAVYAGCPGAGLRRPRRHRKSR